MNRFFGRIADEAYVRTTGRFVEGRTELDLLSSGALEKIFYKRAKDAVKDHRYPPLSREEEKEIREYYAGCPPFSTIYHRAYKGRTGVFDPAVMPDDLYYRYIEPYYNNREAARYIDNKALYYHLFPDDAQPELIVMRMGNLWFGGDRQPITTNEVLRLLCDTKGELVMKRAENSEQGAGVFFLPEEGRIRAFRAHIKECPEDVIIQRAVKQHEAYQKLHPESVNTLRIMSFLTPHGAEILTTCARIGAGESRMDNIGSGGLFVGVREALTSPGDTSRNADHTHELGSIGMMHGGVVIREHPTLHYRLEGQPIVGVKAAHELVRRLHPVMGKFRIVSWDIAVDETGQAVLIETNVSLGGIFNVQACAGPVFGKNTRAVIEEVFYGKR